MANIDRTLLLNSTVEDRLFSLYPELAKIEKNTWFKLFNQSLLFTAPPHTAMQTRPGPYDHFLLLIEGSTRVYQADESGREVTFYRNYPGDVCPINLNRLFETSDAAPYIQAESVINALQISSRAFHQVLQESDIFRKFIFSRLSYRFIDMTQTFEDSVFNKLDSRLGLILKKLLTHAPKNTLNITHQKLANELGTTREVISRSLKTLENKGFLKITRGQLTMISPEKLTHI